MTSDVFAHDPVEHLPPRPSGRAGIVLTCEHASNRLPAPWSWPEADRALVDTHWAIDLGAAALTRALAEAWGCGAVLSRVSRLLIDPNRPLRGPDGDWHPTLFRRTAEDDRPVALNADVHDAEARIAACYVPYHAAVDALVAGAPGARVLSIHSFTPEYRGAEGWDVRDVELGVLWDEDVEAGEAWLEALRGSGFTVRGQEPWSGAGGYMHSAQSHAAAHGRVAVEIEARQDLLADPAAFRRLRDALLAAGDAVWPDPAPSGAR